MCLISLVSGGSLVVILVFRCCRMKGCMWVVSRCVCGLFWLILMGLC